jgi:hypothetical protein
MENLVTLTNLSPREAVADALYRCTLGADTNNHDLFASGCLNDETMTIVFGQKTLNGWDAGKYSQSATLFRH